MQRAEQKFPKPPSYPLFRNNFQKVEQNNIFRIKWT